MQLLKIRKKADCSKIKSSSTISRSNNSNIYEEEMSFIETNEENESTTIDKNSDMIDVDTVLQSQLNKRYKNSNEDSKSAQTILSGDYDCEQTAGNVEAIFTLIFFLSFVIYLIYMFAIIP